MTFQGIPYTEMPKESRKQKACVVCGTLFTPSSGVHKFCSHECKGKWQYITERVTTKTQYLQISGNWDRYFSRLLQRAFRRSKLSRDVLFAQLAKQDGKCALSGIPLTCQLQQGVRFKTNASIDRLKAGEEYSPENIQLVCAALNSWRGDTDLKEFIWYCAQVTKHQEQKGGYDGEDKTPA
jgi:predicted nucleic acid-binding Zn ribbon protein